MYSGSGIEVDEPTDGSLANWAELRVLVGAHAAVVCGAENAFQTIACAFEGTYRVCVHIIIWCRQRCGRCHHVAPFALEVHHRGNVGFPRLHVGWVHGYLFLFVGILVGQAGETVSEFMNHHRAEFRVMGHAQVVAVQNTVLRDVAALGYFLGDANLVQAATTQGELVTASILSTVDVDPVTATKDPVSGMYNVVLTNAQIAAGDTIAILHYNETTKVWELIKPLAVGQGSVAFQSASLSPITIVKVNTTTAAQAPKTGAMPYGVVTMILIGLMGAVICYRNYRRA